MALCTPFVTIALIVTSGPPIFYRRERLGREGRLFRMVKFRTMVEGNTETSASLRTAQNDPRISKIGRVLRQSYIDELPQFWNVLRGDMSVVGPRPEFPELAKELKLIRSQFPKRLTVKPGITGLAQIYYSHSHTNDHAARRLHYDLEYVKRASFRVDLWIITRTITRSLRFRGS